MTCQIANGGSWLDITPFIAKGGWKDSRNDVEGNNAGRNIEGTMIRDRVAIKYRIDVTCIPLKKTELDAIRAVLYPESFQIRFKDDASNVWTYRTVYSNNFSWTYCMKKGDAEYYEGFSFPLIDM